MAFIYCLASDDTIYYVGQTNNPSYRLSQHRSSDSLVSRFVSKDAYDMIILDECDTSNALETEGFYIEWLEPQINTRFYRGSHLEADRAWKDANPDKRKESLHKYNTSEKRKEVSRRYWLRLKERRLANSE